jgi:hypothetical protein
MATKAKTEKTKKEKKVKQVHPFGAPPERAKGFTFPSLNPTLRVYAGKSVSALPQNLQDVFQAVEKYKDGIALRDLKIAKLSTKTTHWLVRQLAKHEFLRVKAEDKPPKKPTVSKKAGKPKIKVVKKAAVQTEEKPTTEKAVA